MSWNRAKLPSLHHRKEGRVPSQIRFREATKADAAGGVFLWYSIGKQPRPRVRGRLGVIFLTARPPLLAVMQGGEYSLTTIYSHFHRPRLQCVLVEYFRNRERHNRVARSSRNDDLFVSRIENHSGIP